MEFDLTGNHAYNVDCMEFMRQVPDKYFDLSCCDPPYGGGADKKPDNSSGGGNSQAVSVNTRGQSQADSADGLKSTISVSRTGGTWAAKYSQPRDAFSSDSIDVNRTGGRTARYLPGGKNIDPDGLQAGEIEAERDGRGWAKKYSYDIRSWDVAPPQEYFDELARISKNVVLWGGNYYSLPPTRCFLVWEKLSISETFTMAMCEYAWTSFNENAKIFKFAPQGKKDDPRFHPAQKPIELYAWIYGLFAKPGYKIFDSHLGSGSSRIAAYNAGLDFIGCEIDPVYFEKEEERFAKYAAQQSLFHD